MFQGLTREMGFYTSKNFLPGVAAASKAGKRVMLVLSELHSISETLNKLLPVISRSLQFA